MNVAATTAGRAAPELREVPQPSALEGDRRRFWHLLWLTSLYEYRRQYMDSALGQIWSLIKPLFLFAILLVLLTKVIKFGDGVPHFAGSLLIGIMLFQFFSDGADRAVFSLVGAQHLIRKVRIPRMVIPLSIVLTASITTAWNLVAAFGLLILLGIEPMWSWLLVPVVLGALLIVITGLALLLSALYVYFRDVDQIWTVISRALFYGSPVIYTIDVIEPGSFLRDFMFVNPLTPIMVQARVWFVDPNAPDIFEAVSSPLILLIPLGVTLAICVAGFFVFKRVAERAAEDL